LVYIVTLQINYSNKNVPENISKEIDQKMKDDKYFLYIYRKSLGNKHTGAIILRDVEILLNTIAKLTFCIDVSEIRVTDTSDFMVLHWKEKEGILHPPEIKDMQEYSAKEFKERKLSIHDITEIIERG